MSKNPKAFEIKITRNGFVSSVPRWNYRYASTPTWRFYWNPTPGAFLHSHGKSLELTSEVAVLIPPQTPFSTEAKNKFSHFFVHFTIQQHCLPEKRRIWEMKSSDIILPVFKEELPYMSEQKRYLTASSIVQAALTRIPEEIFSHSTSNNETLFEKVIKLLAQDEDFSLTYEKLAQQCNTGINTMQRQFISATGLSIHKWQLNRKMEKAVTLLLHDGLSIKETAYILGFADRYHFSKAFKNYFGISPAQFVKSGGIPLP